jgi:integrase
VRGSMREKDGRGVWELRVYLGRDENNRIRQYSKTFRGTKRQASSALAALVTSCGGLLESQAGPVLWDERTTVNDALEAWSKNGWQDLSPNTLRHYRSLWDNYVRTSIGRKPIATLGPYEVEQYFRRLKTGGVGQTTIRHIRGMLNRACRLARKWSGNHLPNPILDTELPAWGIQERRDQVRAPDAGEVRKLLAAADTHDERFGPFLRLLAATGMRRGEACALRWWDIDFRARTITVDESIVAAPGGATVKSPKTRASIRRLSIDPRTLSALEALRARQNDLAEAAGEQLGDEAFVFSTEPGGSLPPHPDTMSHMFTRIRDNAKVADDLHLHSLRHFHATVLDPVISEAQKQARLGWSTVRMARHYTDAIGAEDRRAANHVGKLLDTAPRRTRAAR